MLLFGVENTLADNRLPLIRQGKALPPSPQGEGLRQRSLPKGESKDCGITKCGKQIKRSKHFTFGAECDTIYIIG